MDTIERILKLKGEWRLRKRKRFMRRLLAWVLMIALLGGALFIYLNYMQPEEIEIISPEAIEDIRG
jgi:cell division septal protein FtsQ|tara:strand:- start:46 stop:243 length:198 start_codon:yes stop_codon:yes gene_type:complete